MFTDLTDVSVDEVSALLLSRVHLRVLLNLAVNEPEDQVHVGHDLLHPERVAKDVLQKREEVQGSSACMKEPSTSLRLLHLIQSFAAKKILIIKLLIALLMIYDAVISDTFVNCHYLCKGDYTVK